MLKQEIEAGNIYLIPTSNAGKTELRKESSGVFETLCVLHI